MLVLREYMLLQNTIEHAVPPSSSHLDGACLVLYIVCTLGVMHVRLALGPGINCGQVVGHALLVLVVAAVVTSLVHLRWLLHATFYFAAALIAHP